jgi:hypothetical protein
VGVSVVKDFATVSLPQYDGNGVRAKLPGKYTATTKDLEGKTVTFSVTIATGVNEATEKAYHDMNRLVVLGFAPCGVEYADPEKAGLRTKRKPMPVTGRSGSSNSTVTTRFRRALR